MVEAFSDAVLNRMVGDLLDFTRLEQGHLLLKPEPAELGAIVEEVAIGLMTHMRWEASAGFELTDEMRLLIAAQAGLLTIGLDDPDPYWRVGPIIVYPHGVVKTGERGGPVDGVATALQVALLATIPLHLVVAARRVFATGWLASLLKTAVLFFLHAFVVLVAVDAEDPSLVSGAAPELMSSPARVVASTPPFSASREASARSG